jgi:hypothetical protein
MVEIPGACPTGLPEAQRFFLDLKVDVDALKLLPVGKMIVKAAQIYSFVVKVKD